MVPVERLRARGRERSTSGRATVGETPEALGLVPSSSAAISYGGGAASPHAPIVRGFGADDAGNTKASQLVDRLREAILSGALPPGSKINLDRVRHEFDVSLSPLREALARLIA